MYDSQISPTSPLALNYRTAVFLPNASSFTRQINHSFATLNTTRKNMKNVKLVQCGYMKKKSRYPCRDLISSPFVCLCFLCESRGKPATCKILRQCSLFTLYLNDPWSKSPKFFFLSISMDRNPDFRIKKKGVSTTFIKNKSIYLSTYLDINNFSSFSSSTTFHILAGFMMTRRRKRPFILLLSSHASETHTHSVL